MENSGTFSKTSSKNKENINNLKGATIPKYNIVSNLIDSWHKNYYINGKDLDQCYVQFIKELENQCKIKVRFDNSISQILAEKSKEIKFFEYSLQNKPNSYKRTLETMNDSLKENQFISNRQYVRFKNKFLTNSIEQSIFFIIENLTQSGYLIKNSQKGSQNAKREDYNEQDRQKLQNIWEMSMVGINIIDFWQYILNQQIETKETLKIFVIYIQILKKKDLNFYRNLKQYFKKVKTKLDSLKHQKIDKIKNHLSSRQYNNLLENHATQISLYLNKQRWQKFNLQYQSLKNALISRCSIPDIKFQTFGSFKSKFHILNYSDIDVVLIYQTQYLNSKEKKAKLLYRMQQALQSDRDSCCPHYQSSKVVNFPTLPHPYIKISYNSNNGQNKDVIASIDVIINNREGIENSVMLSRYSQNQYILKFCNLLKFWASKTDLINQKSKFKGISSYGIILMALYYLMVTKQIPFLKSIGKDYFIGQKQFHLEKTLYQNFIGFLQFYSIDYMKGGKIYTGQFHKQKRLVCLLEQNDGQIKRQNDIIINMYDFIDDTNPGRMRTNLSYKFIQIFQKSLNSLYSLQKEFLFDLFQQAKIEPHILAQKKGNNFKLISQLKI